jgi:hypothetical protein
MVCALISVRQFLINRILALRVEWAKSRARALRYVEEEELTLVEMGRVLRYFSWRMSWWRETAGEGMSVGMKRACRAYAEKQASALEKLSSKFQELWINVAKELDLSVSLKF